MWCRSPRDCVDLAVVVGGVQHRFPMAQWDHLADADVLPGDVPWTAACGVTIVLATGTHAYPWIAEHPGERTFAEPRCSMCVRRTEPAGS